MLSGSEQQTVSRYRTDKLDQRRKHLSGCHQANAERAQQVSANAVDDPTMPVCVYFVHSRPLKELKITKLLRSCKMVNTRRLERDVTCTDARESCMSMDLQDELATPQYIVPS